MSETTNWNPAIIIYLDEDRGRVGTRIIDLKEIDAVSMAGILTNLLDAVVDGLAECDQVKFEQRTLEIFALAVQKRHNYTSKEKFKNDN